MMYRGDDILFVVFLRSDATMNKMYYKQRVINVDRKQAGKHCKLMSNQQYPDRDIFLHMCMYMSVWLSDRWFQRLTNLS